MKILAHSTLLVLGVLAGSVVIVGQAYGASAPGLTDRVTFQMALQALQEDDAAMARQLLTTLVERAGGTPEGAVYEALLASADGRGDERDSRLRKVLADTPPDAFTDPWVYEELVRRVAASRLADLRQQADERLEEVLSKHYEARGGLQRLQALSDIVTTGRMLVGGGELPFRLARKRPHFYRLDVLTPQGLEITATDGKTAWHLAAGSDTPERLEGDRAAELIDQSDFDDVLVRFRESGDRLLLSDPGDADASRPLRIEVQPRRGHRQVVLLDPATFLETERLIWVDPEQQPVRMTFEYRQEDGMPMAARQVVDLPAGGRIEYLFDEYVLDRPIDPSHFEMTSGSPTPEAATEQESTQ